MLREGIATQTWSHKAHYPKAIRRIIPVSFRSRIYFVHACSLLSALRDVENRNIHTERFVGAD